MDRSAAYAARFLAKNLVAAGVADEVKIQVAYAIGIAEPVSLFVDTYGRSNVGYSDSEIARKLLEVYDLRPYSIVESLKLKHPIYRETSAYGHMGRTPRSVVKHFDDPYGQAVDKEVELFTWEQLSLVDEIKKAFF